MFRKGCEGGDPAGCTGLGEMFFEAQALPRDESKAFELFRMGCDGSDPEACSQLRSRQTVERKSKACEAGSAKDCYSLSRNYASGHGVALDLNKTVELLAKSCDGGHAQGCDEAGSYYSTGAERAGTAVLKDGKKAAELYRKGCESPDEFAMNPCMSGGRLFWKGGAGLEKDLSQAVWFFRKACELRNSLGCRNAEEIEQKLGTKG